MKMLILAIVLSTSALSQTRLINHVKHYIAILDQQDSELLYNALDIEPVEKAGHLIKTMGPEEKLVEVSCVKKDNAHSCYGMLKFFNIEDKKPSNFFFVSDVSSGHVSSWFNQLDIPEQDFGGGHYFKEFAAHDEGMYFNCRRSGESKQCRLGIRIE